MIGLAFSLVPQLLFVLLMVAGLLSSVLHWAGIGLLVAAALSGRARMRPGAQLPE